MARSAITKRASSRTPFMVVVVATILMITMWSYFLYYFNKLKQSECVCALTWRRTTLQALLATMILMLVINLVTSGRYNVLVTLLNVPISAAFILITFLFINNVKSTECECAKTFDFYMLTIINIISLVWYALSLITVVYILMKSKSK